MISNSTKRCIQTQRGLWEICVGLEVHAQILSKSKLFSGSSAATDSATTPNSHVSFVDGAFPGTLPVVNAECVAQGIRTALALGSQVQNRSMFERKHYFYCDLPQGYQITQQRAPLAIGGHVHLEDFEVRGVLYSIYANCALNYPLVEYSCQSHTIGARFGQK